MPNEVVNSGRATPPGVISSCALGALAMSYGWGFRGVYGHEAGAMVPGALLGMAVCIASGRSDWFWRIPVAGLAGAVGWAFGGSMSYGNVPGYTVSQSFPDVCYGYASLFVIGALWGGIGGGILSLALTESRGRLQQFAWLIALLQIVWVLQEMATNTFPELFDAFEQVEVTRDTSAATVVSSLLVLGTAWLVWPAARRASGLMLLLAAGWWLGHLVLVKLTGFHMQPKPGGEYRSDAWAGCTGMLVVLLGDFLSHKNRAGVMLALYGLVAGGLGFAIGNFVNIPDKVRWEPFWRHEFLRGFDHWKWTEQSFGFIMGLGVALGVWRLARGGLAAPREDGERAFVRVNDLAAFAILVVVPWMNLSHNVDKWREQNKLAADLMFGRPPGWWLFVLGAMMALIVFAALYRHRRGRLALAPSSSLGKGQLLFLVLMWVTCIGSLFQSLPLQSRGAFFIDWSFWFTCLVCTFLVVMANEAAGGAEPTTDGTDRCFRVGWSFFGLCVVTPALIALLSYATIKMQTAPNDGAQLRFGPNATHLKAKD